MTAAPKLLEEASIVARLKHLSLRTEKVYLQHIKRFILFHDKRHPKEMGEAEIRAYLSDLAVNKNVAASTQNVALAALLFLYKDVLHRALERIGEVERARLPSRLPVVFTKQAAAAILSKLTGSCFHTHVLNRGLGVKSPLDRSEEETRRRGTWTRANLGRSVQYGSGSDVPLPNSNCRFPIRSFGSGPIGNRQSEIANQSAVATGPVLY
jgi:hypothetical protein